MLYWFLLLKHTAQQENRRAIDKSTTAVLLLLKHSGRTNGNNSNSVINHFCVNHSSFKWPFNDSLCMKNYGIKFEFQHLEQLSYRFIRRNCFLFLQIALVLLAQHDYFSTHSKQIGILELSYQDWLAKLSNSNVVHRPRDLSIITFFKVDVKILNENFS